MCMSELVTTIDEHGEVGRARVVMPRRQTDWPFIKLNQKAAVVISGNHVLTETALRVFILLSGLADHNCVVRASQGEIATSVGVSRESVNKAIKILVDQKIISYVAVLGYGLNMDIVRRGASK